MEVVNENGTPVQNQESKRIIAGVLGIILGSFAVHKLC